MKFFPFLRRNNRVHTKPVHPKATVTFRHNILPPLMGLLICVGVFALLNGQWVGAQVQYRVRSLRQDTTVVPLFSEQAALDPQAEPRLLIPSVDIDVPYIVDEPSYDESKVQKALHRGVVHFGTTAMPGQVGNMVIVGHSSGSLWSPGSYKYAFTLLNKVKDSDLLYIDYKGERFVYRITWREVVEPTDIRVLEQSTNTPEITLITCTPIGTNSRRLVLHGTQISPSPTKADRAEAPAGIGAALKLPQ